MKRKLYVLFMALIFTGIMTSSAKAAIIDLVDWAYNIDGTIFTSPANYSGPSAGQLTGTGIDDSGFTYSSGQGSGGGIGSIGVTITGAGAHFVDLFVDHEIDEATNTFFNEFGDTGGAAAAGQSWEVDEPGFLFGDIRLAGDTGNFGQSTLDNFNNVPAGLEEDVSMALGWDFNLIAGETASIGYLVSQIMPTGGFFLSHTDPDSLETIYFSSTLAITGGAPAPVPEPSTFILSGIGIAGLVVTRKRWRKRIIKS